MTAWLTDRKWPFVAAALALVLASPALQLGYLLDDKFHQAALRPDLDFPGEVDPVWGLFAFMDGTPERNQAFMDAGVLPWWTDPGLRAQFLRPVTALTHMFDDAVARGDPTFAHAHSLMWLGACVLLAGLLYRRVFGPTVAAGLAALMFAVEDAHGIPTAWLANRNALVALAFGLGCLVLHHEGQQGRRWAARAAPMLLLVSLLSAEAGVGTAAYLLAYAVFMPTPVWAALRRGDPAEARRRVGSLAPYLVVLVAWKVAHAAGGFGTSGSGMYVDPSSEPLAFSVAAAERIPPLLFAQWTPVPAEVVMVMSAGARWAFAAAAAVATAGLIAWAWRRGGARPDVGWLLAGSVLAAVPVAAAFPSNRLLGFVGVGVFGALGVVLARWWPASLGARRWVSERSAQPAERDETGGPTLPGRDPLIVALIVTHLVIAPVVGLFAAPGVQYIGEVLPGRCADAVGPDTPIENDLLVFINGHELCGAYVGTSRQLAGATRPRGVRVLASVFTDVELTRVGPHALELHVPNGYQSHPFDRLMRSADQPIPVGRRVGLAGLTVEVLEHNDDGFMSRVRFTFDRPLEDPTLRFFVLDQEGAKPFSMPEPGRIVRIPAVL